ncbi:hypothetical protein SLEP1_g52119 [Rubroshorea leprosula]|uniref:Uncharacterized protein n=1 Tax=Rubroshorea leprosula TaxID=152421 RepID=A0AAV5M6Z1_9ROSI|nr:hypothetical protein SLEP1_g52119 [Rubroshorea leprosula]
MQRRTKGEDATDDDTPSTSGRQFADSHVSQVLLFNFFIWLNHTDPSEVV